MTVTGVRSARGEVDICVFDRPQHFPNCHAIGAALHGHVPARVGAVSETFRNLAPGVYAVSAYHDENGSGRLETSWLGIPTEGVGASRNPRGVFGPPSFRQAAFTLGPAGGAIVVALVYP